jgi:hypothetical protein
MASTIRESLQEVIKFIIYMILEVALFFVIIQTIGGMTLPNLETTFLVISLLSIVNAILWPVLSLFSLRFVVLTLGFGTFLSLLPVKNCSSLPEGVAFRRLAVTRKGLRWYSRRLWE